MATLFYFLDQVENLLWVYFCFPAILLTGLWLTFSSRAVQIRKFGTVVRNFFTLLFKKDESCNTAATAQGIHPIKVFFACIGGCVGIGNVVGITTAVQIGGPGAIFWIWVTAMVGALVKYAEVYLGMRHRVLTKEGYRGGPMYFLSKAFPSAEWLVKLFCVLLCLYGVEVYQFSVMTSSVAENFSVPKIYVVLFFLACVLGAETGGLRRVSSICSTIIPAFIVLYLGMGIYVLACSYTQLPQVFVDIFHYAFTPHAPIGAFAGSSLSIAISQGIRRACYSCDVGVGYASIVHSESSVQKPAKQASLTIFEVFLDTFLICTMSVVIVLVTGSWKENIDAMYLVQSALSNYFPYMNYFIPIFLVVLGYSTIITYFCSGMKTALFLSPKYGRRVYYLYAVASLFLFSFVDTTQANTAMMCVLAVLLALNIFAIIRLRGDIKFDLESELEPAHNDAIALNPQVALAE